MGLAVGHDEGDLQLDALHLARAVQGCFHILVPGHEVRQAHHDGRVAARGEHAVCVVHVLLPEVGLAAPGGVVVAQLAARQVAAQVPAGRSSQ